jgi:hypothetical protein
VSIDTLEPRALLSAINMTDQEQLLLELVNRARLNPTAEAARSGISLNKGLPAGTISTAPKQPLAPHQSLVNAARLHSDKMLEVDQLEHELPNWPSPADRVRNAGYPQFTFLGENIGWEPKSALVDLNAAVGKLHRALFVSEHHRTNIMSPFFEELGAGVREGIFTDSGVNANAVMITENFAQRNVNPLITGVVYTDSDNDNFYSIGEAIRSGTITATETTSGLSYSESVGNSGGYGIIVPAGTYSVVFRYQVNGANYRGVKTVTVGSDNVKVDFKAAELTVANLSATVSPASMYETGAQTTVTLTVSRTGSTSTPLVVMLSSSDLAEATLPASVTIPAGQTSAQATVTAVNDGILDGSKVSTLTASAIGFPNTTTTVTTIDTTLPTFPVPAVETDSPRPMISWNAIPNAGRYVIWVNNLSTGEAKVIYQTNVTTNSYTPSFDLPLGVYQAWIQAFTAGGLSSPWSTAQTLRIKTPPTVNTSMVTVFSADFVYSWVAQTGASTYDVWIDRLTSSTSQYFRNTSVGQASVNLTNFAIGRYGVWVRGRTSTGHLGSWSNRGQIAVSLAPTGVNITAADFSSDTTVRWSPVSGATSYEIWVDSRTTGAASVVRQRNISATEYQLPTLPAGSYAVWIRAFDAQSSSYAWSNTFEFDIRKTARVLTPSGTGNSTTPLFSWTSVSGASLYDIWVSSLSGGGVVVNVTGLTTTSFTPQNALASGNYRVWIRAFDSAASDTGWSMFRDFSVAAIEVPGKSPLTPRLNTELRSIDELLPLIEIDNVFAEVGREASIIDESEGSVAVIERRTDDEEFCHDMILALHLNEVDVTRVDFGIGRQPKRIP